MNKQNESEIYIILKRVSDKGVGWSYRKGFKWFKNIFMHCLETARNSSKYEKDFIADCFYVLGDIHDFNNAPFAAIRAYSKALKYDNNLASAYREMAGMYQNMGNYAQASLLIDKAVKIDPDDEYALLDQKDIYEELTRKPEPLFKKPNIIWECDELLADSKPNEALSLLKGFENTDFCKAKARCYGFLSDCANYLEQWKKISEMNSELEFSYSDWFYMPEQIFESSEIWYLLLGIYKKIRPGVFPYFDTLFDSERYKNLPDAEKYRLMIEFNIYRTEKKSEKLKYLFKLYPEWSELNEIIDKST